MNDRSDAGSTIDGVITALADPTRRQVLDLISQQGWATATALAERLPISRQAIVKHLAVLDGAGLVSGMKVGREARYSVRSAGLEATAQWMAGLAAEWDRRLARMKQIAEAAERE